jgi:hypothetical protein
MRDEGDSKDNCLLIINLHRTVQSSVSNVRLSEKVSFVIANTVLGMESVIDSNGIVAIESELLPKIDR